MSIRFTASFVLLGVCVCGSLATDATPEQIAKVKADEVAQATVKGDFGKLADLTYPKIVELMGGRDKMIAAVESGVKSMKAKGFEFRSAKVGDAAPLVPGSDDVYTVVPFTLEMKAPGGKASMKSFLLGISSDKGKTWTFVDGAQIGDNPRLTKKLLPNLPEKLKLPKKEKPVFHKDE